MMTTRQPIQHPRPASNCIALPLLLALAVGLPAQGLHIGPPPEPVPQPHPQDPPIRRPPHVLPPAPAIHIASLDIRARIVDGIATTTLTQVFKNEGGRVGEGTWILPLPPGATADHFTMTMNGEQVSGEVLDANKAREIYTGIVRRQQDPGLLEYMGNGCLRARIFPIQAGAEMKIEVRYRHALPATGGTHHWWFPLRAANVNGSPARRIGLDVTIASKTGIKNVYSPNPGVDVARKDDHHARISLELSGGKVPARDLDVFYGTTDQAFGLDLLAYREPGQPGYFLMMLAPKLEWAEGNVMPKCINFVLDTSGSMAGEKIEQARGALKFFVNSLKVHDHFNVIPFSTEARPLFDQPRLASKENVAKALELAASLEARGGTNIEKALTTALSAEIPAAPDLPDTSLAREVIAMTVFLTDGLPTVDTTDPKTLLGMIAKSNANAHRIFVFGVGHDVNTHLLDKIAEQSHGARDYVGQDESIEVKTSALFTKLSSPVMTKVRIDAKGIAGFDVHPKTTPDLFMGSHVTITGRYKGSGHHAITLTGIVEGKEKTFVYESTFPENDKTNDFIPTLWAQRKVAVLLDNLRLNGTNQELIDEIRRLGIEHGIVTPYTSHLILEEGQRVARVLGGRQAGSGSKDFFTGSDRRAAPSTPGPSGIDPIARDLARRGVASEEGAAESLRRLDEDAKKESERGRQQLDDIGSQPSGEQAVGRSRDLLLRAQETKLGGAGGGVTRFTTQRVKGHSFHLVGGVWIDGRFEARHKDAVREVKAFSDDYFTLLKEHPEVAPYLAFSSRILVVLGELVVEIV